MLYFNEDSGNVVFPCNEMGILTVNLNNIHLENLVVFREKIIHGDLIQFKKILLFKTIHYLKI